MTRARAPFPSFLLALALLLGGAGAALAQTPPDTADPMGLRLPSQTESFPVAMRTVSGSVQLPDPPELRPAVGAWVTLHRVGGGRGAPLDSVRTGGDGTFAIRYRRAAEDDAVFFLSASWAGITYFSPPLPNADVRGDDADLIVYDTTTGPLSIRLRGRHIVVGAIDSTRRRPVVEIFEIGNDSSVTLVSAGEDRPTWSVQIPERAQDFRVMGGDVSAEAVTRSGTLVQLFAPIAPGVKQVSVLYSLPRDALPALIPITESVEILEVLVEGPAGTVQGSMLQETEGMTVEGRPFRRFLARDVPPSGVVQIDLPQPPATNRTLYVAGVLVALGLLMLLALGRSIRRRPSPVPAWAGVPGAGMNPDDLARRIAALDAAFQRRRAPSAEERAEYERQRGGLKAMLTDALVHHGER